VTRRLSKQDAATAAPDLTDLPPPGDARRETLKARQDTLEAAIAAMPDDHERLDPSRYRPIREVQGMLAESLRVGERQPISGQLPDYEYCLVRFKEPGSQVEIKETQEVWDSVAGCKVAVWEVVQGTMPEMAERRDVHGYRVIADTLLMRGRKDRVAAWRDHEAWYANRHQRQQLAEINGPATARGVRIVESHQRETSELTVTPSVMREALAKQLGTQLVTERLKAGTQPGL
jgi:hypothetical protein